MGFWKTVSDIEDKVLEIGAGFDWITPLYDIASGTYNTLEYRGDGETAVEVEQELRRHGVKCAIRNHGSEYAVISKK